MTPKPAVPMLEIQLVGHLTVASVQPILEGVVTRPPAAFTLLVDCTLMEGYDPDARDFFVRWNAEMRPHCLRLAVVTRRQLWHVVVSGMALAARQKMKAFHQRAEARQWLREA